MIAARRLLPLWLGLAVAAALPAQSIAQSVSGDQVVADWRTGLALHGFDPVAYFVDRQPRAGASDQEYAFAGAVWRFRNAGNRAAFAAHPQTYTPAFGGHDPVAVGRGVATPGNPLVWLVSRGKLYLFHDTAARDAFVADPAVALARASARWDAVAETLIP